MQETIEVEIAQIDPSHVSLRGLDESIVLGLAKSIISNGLLQPILVTPVDCSYEVVFGNHRLEACKRLGWKRIPAFIKEMSQEDCFLTRVVENLHRNVEMNALTEAKGYIALVDRGWTINKIAERIGKSDSYVSDRIGLIRRLHPAIARRFDDHSSKYLRPSHLELLAHMKSKRRQLELSHVIETKHLSVRKLEELIGKDDRPKETVLEKQDLFYIQVPLKIARYVGIQGGDSVYVYAQGKRRIVVEPAPPKQQTNNNCVSSQMPR